MLIAKRGKPRIGGTDVMSWMSCDRTKHSAKPHAIRKTVVEKLSGPPYLELFARQVPRGWSAFGNQVSVQAELPEVAT